MTITVLTPTGARPDAFAACVDMMRVQTFTGHVKWVIVDDGPIAMPTPYIEDWEIVHLRPKSLWKPGMNTQRRNMLFGLNHCTDRIVIVEDDDGYAPWWVEKCNEWLDHDDLVGESHALYVHRETGKSKLMSNSKHASLCSTAVKGTAIDALRKACEESGQFIDIRLWREMGLKGKLYHPSPRGVTGIKGWPGRPGIGYGHTMGEK